LALLELDEMINNGCLLDWDGVSVDLFESGDVSVLDETAEFGLWNPLVFAGTAEATTASATTATSSATTIVTTTTATESTTTAAAFSWSLFSSGCFTFHLF
jgi:hypothetical protein